LMVPRKLVIVVSCRQWPHQTLDNSRWRMSAGIDSHRSRAGLVKVGSDSIAADHSSNNSECVPARTKMMVLPSRR
jgi:hypothetical protein